MIFINVSADKLTILNCFQKAVDLEYIYLDYGY